jgi:hypothetical protein
MNNLRYQHDFVNMPKSMHREFLNFLLIQYREKQNGK